LRKINRSIFSADVGAATCSGYPVLEWPASTTGRGCRCNVCTMARQILSGLGIPRWLREARERPIDPLGKTRWEFNACRRRRWPARRGLSTEYHMSRGGMSPEQESPRRVMLNGSISQRCCSDQPVKHPFAALRACPEHSEGTGSRFPGVSMLYAPPRAAPLAPTPVLTRKPVSCKILHTYPTPLSPHAFWFGR